MAIHGGSDALQVQSRIKEDCPAGQYLREIKADGTVECAPSPTLPKAVHTTGAGRQLSDLDSDTLVHSVTLNVPSAGTVLVQASGNLVLLHAGNAPQIISRAWCAISLGTSVIQAQPTVADVLLTVTLPHLAQGTPFALTRGFDVPAPGMFTANLICLHLLEGKASVSSPSLTALFVPVQ